MTTVGYGDSFPTTDEGRAIAMLVMCVGIGFVALLTAFVADRFIREDAGQDLEERQAQILAKLDSMDERLQRVERRVTDR